MVVHITEKERLTEQENATRVLRDSSPGCTCWIKTWIVNNGSDFARFENEHVVDRLCPVHSP